MLVFLVGITMSNEEVIKILTKKAEYLSSQYPSFETDELVAEAWIRGKDEFHKGCVSSIGKADMLDYIREQTHSRRKGRLKITNMSVFGAEDYQKLIDSFEDVDRYAEELDDRHRAFLVQYILEKSYITDDDRNILKAYFLEDNSEEDIQRRFGIKSNYLRNKIAHIIRKIRRDLDWISKSKNIQQSLEDCY